MLRFLAFLIIFAALLPAAGTTVRFDPGAPETGPFPADSLTVADSGQKTSVRVNLPLPDCTAQPSSCNELNLVNQMDGFSLNARVRASFSAAIDTTTVTSGFLLMALDNLTAEEPGIYRSGDTIGVNQVVWDAATNTVYAKPDNVLDQHRRYALLILDAIKDSAGDSVASDPAFQVCASGNGDSYCTALAAAVATASASLAPRKIVGASVFTTMSATTWLEKARAQLANIDPAVSRLQPRSTFKIADFATISLNQQTGVDPVKLSSLTIPLSPSLFQGLSGVVVGSYDSPNYLGDDQTIPTTPTAVDIAAPNAINRVYFNALLPDTPRPKNGYPVVIFGHGFGDSRFGGPTAVGPNIAGSGFVILAINAAGHGSGPAGTVSFIDKAGAAITIPAGGRSVDLNGDGVIEPNEGCAISTPVAIGIRDCLRQTAVDLLQLVRAVQAGIDLDGDGTPDLDASRIYYAGQSLGAIYGAILNALEPGIRAAGLNVGGAPIADIVRWSPSYRSLATNALRLRTPSLLNQGDSWDEDYVLRDQPVKRTTVAGALDIQNFFETLDWIGMTGDPLAFAPHLKRSPLGGNKPKPILIQMARADRTIPNFASSALIRAANLQESTWMYRHDVVIKSPRVTDLPLNPHPYLVLFVDLDGATIKLPGPAGLAISISAQQQIADFLLADGAKISDPNNFLIQFLVGSSPFEVPSRLPEDFGF